MIEEVQKENPNHSVAAFLVHQGLHGVLKMHHHDLASYEHSIKKGHKAVDHHIESLFSSDGLPAMDHEKAKKSIHEWIEKGGITHDLQQEIHNQNAPEQHLAAGGEVDKKHHPHGVLQEHPIMSEHPEHNTLIHTAKGRMSHYLNSLKPQEHAPRLAFDDEPDHRHHKKSYDRALSLAAHPLGILEKVKKGTIEPEHVKHFNELHPEVNDVLQKKLTKRIVEAQLKGEKPNSTVRTGLSLMMGTPLSAELTPQNIQAAQATFKMVDHPNPQQGTSAGKNKKGTSSLTKSDQSYLTGNQSLVERSQKQ